MLLKYCCCFWLVLSVYLCVFVCVFVLQPEVARSQSWHPSEIKRQVNRYASRDTTMSQTQQISKHNSDNIHNDKKKVGEHISIQITSNQNVLFNIFLFFLCVFLFCVYVL